jgi:hypothetical protein
MSPHLSDGQIRAAIDGELEKTDLRHLETCAQCGSRQEALRRGRQSAAERLAFLSSPAPGAGPIPKIALSRFHERKLNRKESPSMVRGALRSPVVRYGLPVALVLILILSFPSTRAMADRLLSLFRVQQVTVIPVDFTGLQQLEGQGTLGTQFSELISDSVTATQKPGAPVEVADAAQASQQAGFQVRLPEGLTPSRISVVHSSAFALTVNRSKAQSLLSEAGRGDLVLPASIDGATVSVKIPASVTADYGTCPAPKTEGSETALGSAGSAGRRYSDCMILAEIPSPTVAAPATLDVAQLAQIGLEFTGMSQQQAEDFTRTVNWTSTLVIPIPKNAATYQQVKVDGVVGTLIQRPSDDAPEFGLLWVKGGIVYGISGLGSDSQRALQMANSLP